MKSRMRAILAAYLLITVVTAIGRNAHAAPVSTLRTFDLTPVLRYDLKTVHGKNNAWAEVHLVAALQGLVNRKQPQLYIKYVGDDRLGPGGIDTFWLNLMRAKGGWLAQTKLQPVSTIEDLITVFRKEFRGVVLYDLSVPATSNVASTVAGCDSLLPIPYDPAPGSVFDRLVLHGPHLPVIVRLLNTDGTPKFTGSVTGSAKDDAYLWAKRHYLDTGKCDPGYLDYTIDSWWLTDPLRSAPNTHGLSNHDYFIGRKAFFFDLSPWDDELPQDDPNQPTGGDYRTLIAILRSAYTRTHSKKMIHVGGFVPWAWKYTQTAGGHHGDVATEWRYAAILSCYNAYMDADALGLNAMANASVYAHFPLKSHYPQLKPTLSTLKSAGYLDASVHVVPTTYITFYVGDYDSAAWMYQRLPSLWNDPERGAVPLGWAFDPNLSERFPIGFDWTRRTATANDHFIAGDSGAGYLNPGFLDGERPFSHLPSGLATWGAYCASAYSRWDITLTGFIIDGDAAPMSANGRRAYAHFSPDGLVAQKLPGYSGLIQGTDTPYLTMGADMPNGNQTTEAFERIQNVLSADKGPGPHFHIFRTILWSPTQHKALFDRLADLPGVKIVDPYTLMSLLRIHNLNP